MIIRLCYHPKGNEGAHFMKLADHSLQICLCLHGINLFQHRLGRRQPQLVDLCLVHA
jgi:hypothetical protein